MHTPLRHILRGFRGAPAGPARHPLTVYRHPLEPRDRDFWPHAWTWFSADEAAVRARGGDYVPVHAPETAFRRAPRTLDPRPHWFFGVDTVQDLPSTFVATVPGGAAVGASGAVFAPDGRMLGDLSREFGIPPLAHPALRGPLPPAHRVEGTVLVLAAPGSDVYYHWLLDVLPRLEIARRAGFGLADVDRVLVSGASLPFQAETLARLGIDSARTLDAAAHPHVVADRLVVPSYPGRPEHPPRWACDFLRAALLPRVGGERQARLYVARSDAALRRVTNEPEVREALEARGFRCVALTGLPVAEQAALFASADVVVGPHGSGLANLVFCAPGTRVVELFSRNFVNPCFWSLANQVGLEYAYLIEPGERPPDYVDAHRSGDDITVDVDALLELLGRLDGGPKPVDQAFLGPEATIFRGAPEQGAPAGAA